jgi:hypothetical protein
VIFSIDFEKYPNIKFYENPTTCAELFYADGRDEINSSFFSILRILLTGKIDVCLCATSEPRLFRRLDMREKAFRSAM